MFHIDLSSKRSRLALRFFTYGVMTVATVVITTICIFIAMGYRFDRQKLAFEQGGLVQLRSIPEGARVAVDGKDQRIQTPNKLNMAPGKYAVSMNLKDYRPWSKSVDLAPGQLLWLNYVRLIPNSITTGSVHDQDSLAAIEPSPDQHWILMQPLANAPNFILADVREEQKPVFTTLEVPPASFTKKDNVYGNIQIVEWDQGSRYVLLRHDIPGGPVEFVRLDRSKPAEAINITQSFKLNITETHFAGTNPNILFAKTDDVLRRLDVSANSASVALVSGISRFTVSGNETVTYVAVRERVAGDPATRQQIVGIYKRDKNSVTREFSLDAKIVLAYTDYFDHEYLALGTEDNPVIEIIRDPQLLGTKDNRIFAQFDLGQTLRRLSFSENGRMLLAQNGNAMASYDIEEAKSYRQSFNFGAETGPLRWLDDFYLWTDTGGVLRIVEFDGQNEREITTVKPGYNVLLSANGERLFSVVTASITNKTSLQSSKLVVDK